MGGRWIVFYLYLALTNIPFCFSQKSNWIYSFNSAKQRQDPNTDKIKTEKSKRQLLIDFDRDTNSNAKS